MLRLIERLWKIQSPGDLSGRTLRLGLRRLWAPALLGDMLLPRLHVIRSGQRGMLLLLFVEHAR